MTVHPQSQVSMSVSPGSLVTTERHTAWAYRYALVALVLVSLAVRLFAIGWGIPNFDPARIATSAYRNSYHIDEDNFIWGPMQMRPAQGNFDVVDYHWGTLQFFLIDGTFLAGESLGVIPAPWETAFQNGDTEAIPKLYILGRLVSVLAGVLGTLLVAVLGTLVAGRIGGLAAGAAYAVAPLAVVEAHYLTNDVVMSVFVVAAVLCAVVAVQRMRLRWLFFAGLLLGLGIADKYSAIFAAPALLVAQVLFWKLDSTAALKIRRYNAFIVLAPWLGAALGFLVGEPYVLFVPGKIVSGIQTTMQGNASDLTTGIKQILGMLLWQADNVGGLALTWPLALLALGGVVLLAWSAVRSIPYLKRERIALSAGALPPATPSWIVLAALTGMVVGLALNRVPMLRYSQPLLPLLAVAAGVSLVAIPTRVLRWAIGALAIGVASVITLGQLSIMAGPHPANDLLAWLQGHLQPGQTVAQIWPEYPPLDGAGEYKLIRIDPWNPQLPEGSKPDYIIFDNMAFAPPSPGLADLLANNYHEVAQFSARPQIGAFAWDEGTTPHDWKYSHPTFTVYASVEVTVNSHVEALVPSVDHVNRIAACRALRNQGIGLLHPQPARSEGRVGPLAGHVSLGKHQQVSVRSIEKTRYDILVAVEQLDRRPLRVMVERRSHAEGNHSRRALLCVIARCLPGKGNHRSLLNLKGFVDSHPTPN